MPPRAHPEVAAADALRTTVQQALDAARSAREAADGTTRLAQLERAQAAALTLSDPVLLASTCWRLAKARFDEGHDHALVAALQPLLDRDIEERSVWGIKHRVGPFDHYPAGLRALPALSQRHCDAVGYGPSALDALWQAWIAAREQQGDAFLVAWGHIQRAWPLACRGEVDTVRAITLKHARLTPHTFGPAEHKHPRAVDAAHSVWFVQLDLARTLLRAATWAGRERVAWEARELLEDAAEDAGLHRASDPWFLDAVLRATDTFGWSDTPPAYEAAYDAVARAPTLDAFHQARFGARTRAADRRALLQQAWTLGQQERPGPEWLVEVGRGLAAEGVLPTSEVRALAEHHGVVWRTEG